MHEGYQHIQGDVVSRKGRTTTEGMRRGGLLYVCIILLLYFFKKPEVDMIEGQHLKILE